MKNIFSPKLYLQGLRKIRTLGVAMAIVMIALNAWIPLTRITENSNTVGYEVILQAVEAGQFAPFGLLFLIFVPLLVYNMFSYLNERKASDFFHALPQKRICVYISFMSAILTWIVSVLLLSTAINTILWSMAKYYTASADVIILTALGFLILALVLVGFMALAMMLTGTAVANCLVFFLFFLFIRAFGMFFLYGLESLTPMFNSMYSILSIFEWEFFLPLGLFIKVIDGGETNGAFGNAGFLVYWFAVALLLLIGSAVAYCLRKSENATKSAPNKIMQNIYRIGVTFPFMMLGAFLFITEKEFYSCLLCVLVGFLVWVIFELLTTKKIKNVLRSMPLVLIPVLMTVCFVVSLCGASNFIQKNTPDRDQIVGTKIDVTNGRQNLVNAVLATTEVQSPEMLDLVYQAIEDTKACKDMTWEERSKQGYTYRETIIIRLKSGRKVAYNLISKTDLYEAFRTSVNIREKIILGLFCEDNIYSIYGVEMPQAEYEKIWNAMKADFEALSDKQKDEYINLAATAGNRKGLAFFVGGKYQNMYFEQIFDIRPDYTPTAMDLILQYHEKNESKTLEDLRTLRSQILQYKKPHFVFMETAGHIGEDSLNVINYELAVVQEFLKTITIDEHLTDYYNAKNIYIITFTTQPHLDEANRVKQSFFLTLSEEDIQRYWEIEKNMAQYTQSKY